MKDFDHFKTVLFTIFLSDRNKHFVTKDQVNHRKVLPVFLIMFQNTTIDEDLL